MLGRCLRMYSLTPAWSLEKPSYPISQAAVVALTFFESTHTAALAKPAMPVMKAAAKTKHMGKAEAGVA